MELIYQLLKQGEEHTPEIQGCWGSVVFIKQRRCWVCVICDGRNTYSHAVADAMGYQAAVEGAHDACVKGQGF